MSAKMKNDSTIQHQFCRKFAVMVQILVKMPKIILQLKNESSNHGRTVTIEGHFDGKLFLGKCGALAQSHIKFSHIKFIIALNLN